MKLQNKICLVTGASSGIGRAIALGFAAQGAAVAACGRNAERLEQVATEIKALGAECLPIMADLAQSGGPDKAAAQAAERFGGLDVLVNAAGIFELAPFYETDEAFFDRTMTANFKTAFFMSRAAARLMKERGGGKIISLSSIAGGKIGVPTASVYCTSKAAIAALTQALALELAPDNIKVNCISPGNIRTPMNEHLLADPDYLKAMVDMTPLGRIGETSDLVPLAVYLASEDSDYLTGQQLAVDGGVVCR